MSAYDIDTVLTKWERGTMTTEQAVGQALLHMQSFSQRLGYLEKLLESRRKQIEVRVEEKKEAEERPSSKAGEG